MKYIGKLLLIITSYIPRVINAQEDTLKGIKWVTGLTFDQIKTKARVENKYIFLDLYATWCGPCKAMDRNIYPSKKIGNFVNENFISAQVQVDTTKFDNEEIKKWYKGAHDLQIKYKVFSFPAYLFFSPDGSIVHRGLGYKNIEEFLDLARGALDAKRQFYTLLNKYKPGNKDFTTMLYLVKTLNKIGEKNKALAIATDYKENYLDKMKDSALFSKEKLEFICSFPQLINSKDRFFHFFFYEGKKVDSLLNWQGKSENLVDYVIYNENIYSKLYNEKGLPGTKQPNWKSIEANVRRKYGSNYADRLLLNSQITWYNTVNDSALYTAHLLKKIRKYGVDNGMGIWFNLNSYAWEFFQFSKNRDELNEALKWCDSSIKLNYRAAALDTKANLLYKLGRKDEALEYEILAVKKEQEEAQKYKRSPDTSFQKTLEKMRNNDPSLYVLEMQELYIIELVVSG